MSLFEEIRAACREVAENSKFVRIDHARLWEYVRSLSSSEILPPKLDPAAHFPGHGENTLAFIVILDTINFGSGWFPYLRKRPGLSGYFTIASALRDAFDSEGPLVPERLAELSAPDCARIFNQDPNGMPVRELMEKFALALNQLGRLVLDRYRGKYAVLVESAEESAEKLVRLLSAMTFFDDVELWQDRRVPFYKRAQITAGDLAVAFDYDGWGRFRDLSELTIFADNLVPHVLRIDGVLAYNSELASRIDREQLIPAGSPEEVEIRACALHAVELIVRDLRRLGRSATAMNIDQLLWNRGQTAQYKGARPRHRTRTVFY